MGLSEPVSDSHVAPATVPVLGSPLISPPPYCSSPLPIVSPSSLAAIIPRSSEPPPPNPNLPSDLAPTSTPAPSSGAAPPPVAFPRPDLIPDLCSAYDSHPVPSHLALDFSSSSRSAFPTVFSSTSGLPSSSGGPAPASDGPIVDPSAHRVVPQAPNLPSHPSSSQILPDPLPSVLFPAPISSG